MVEVNERVGRPDLGAQLFAGHSLTGSSQQNGQHLKRLTLQLHLDTALAKFELAQVSFEWTEADMVGGLRKHFQVVSHKVKRPQWRIWKAGCTRTRKSRP